MKKIAKYMMLILVLLILPQTAFAENDVKIGFFPNKFMQMNDTGEITGYGAEYLKKISDISGLNFTYIPIENKDETYNQLASGEIDLAFPVLFMPENDIFIQSSSSLGKTFCAILTLKERGDLYYENYSTFSNITFGIAENSQYEEYFLNYAQLHGFTPNIVKYPTSYDLEEALLNLEIDAMVDNIIHSDDKTMKIIGKLDIFETYIACKSSDIELLKQINKALYDIDMTFPDFQYSLQKKYFPLSFESPYSKEEINFIDSLDTIKIGCPSNMKPISYTENGDLVGISPSILKAIASDLGLDLELVALPDGKISMDYLFKNNIDMISCVAYNNINQTLKTIKLSNPYIDSFVVFITKKGTVLDYSKPMSIAIVEGSETLPSLLSTLYPNFSLLYYKSMEEAMDAILAGKADFLVNNNYTAECYLTRAKYSSLMILPFENWESKLCMATIVNENDEKSDILSSSHFLPVINKAINNIDSDTLSKIMVNYTSAHHHENTFSDFVYTYKVYIVAFLCLFISATIFVIFAQILNHKRISAVLENEKKLNYITSTTNGGLCVILPEDKKVTYINDNILNLLKLTREEFENNSNDFYKKLIHEDDWDVFSHVLFSEALENEKFSVKFRIKRKTGEYIPILLKARAVTNSEHKREIYAALTDITEEIELLEKLSYEQRKTNEIIEKSNDIIFELDTDTGNMVISKRFKEIFGWTFPHNVKNADVDDIVSYFRIHEDDIDVLKKILKEVLQRANDTEADIRIMRTDGTFRWCHVSLYTLSVRNKNNSIVYIGKIHDIDESKREYDNLTALSKTDPLTGLLNKEAFRNNIDDYFELNPNGNCALIFIDLDNFKNVNDVLGHIIGDSAIVDAAQKLQVIFSNCDLISRFGGDEFCVFVKDIPRDTLEKRLQWAVEKLSAAYTDTLNSVQISASIGAACTDDVGYNADALIQYADNSLYHVKNAGKGAYHIFTPLNDAE